MSQPQINQNEIIEREQIKDESIQNSLLVSSSQLNKENENDNLQQLHNIKNDQYEQVEKSRDLKNLNQLEHSQKNSQISDGQNMKQSNQDENFNHMKEQTNLNTSNVKNKLDSSQGNTQLENKSEVIQNKSQKNEHEIQIKSSDKQAEAHNKNQQSSLQNDHKPQDAIQAVKAKDQKESYQQKMSNQSVQNQQNGLEKQQNEKKQLQENILENNSNQDQLKNQDKNGGETILIQQLQNRLNSLYEGVNKLKQETNQKQSELFVNDMRDKYDKLSIKEQKNLESVEKISQNDVKQHAYQLLVNYHKELILLKQQKQVDREEIKRLKIIINSNEKHNQQLQNKIEDLQFQLKEQIKNQTQYQSNKKVEQINNAYNPQQNSELKSLIIKQVNSSYSHQNHISNTNQNMDDISQTNSFIKALNLSEQGITETFLTNRYKDKDANDSDTQTSFNLSPSIQKPQVTKKLIDSFYSNKKRLSLRKEMEHIISNSNFNGEQFQIEKKQPNFHKNQDQKQKKIQIQMKQFKNLVHIQDEKDSPNQQHNSSLIKDPADKYIKLQTNGQKNNIFYDRNQQQTQKDKNLRANQIEKANDKIKNIIKEQKSFSVNQSNSLWINSIDLGDMQDYQDHQDTNQINKSKDKIRNMLDSKEIFNQHQNVYQNNLGQEKIKIILNPKQSSRELSQGDQKLRQQQSINSRIRKSNSIHQSSSHRLDPISQRQQNSKKQIQLI